MSINIFKYLLVFLFCCNISFTSAQIVQQKGFPSHIILNVTEDLSNSMAFNWRTDTSATVNKIQIVKENSSYNLGQKHKEYIADSEIFTFKESSFCYHSILVDGLEPNTSYAYRVGNNDTWSPWMNFKTLNNTTSDTLKVLYFGDVQTNISSLWSRVVKQAFRTIPDAQLLLYAGDIVNRGNNLNEWEEWFGSASFVHQSIPVMPASGNHDHGDNVDGKYDISVYWNKQFNLPKNGIKSLKESSYYINIQDVKFIVLNTELFDTDQQIKIDQLNWLRNILSTNTQKWTVLLMHHPIYSTKKNRDNKELRKMVKPLIDQYDVDLVLQGHDHTYARGKDKIPMSGNKLSNATYVVSVSGPKMSQVLEADWIDKSFSYIQLFQSIEIINNQLKFLTYNAQGEKLDEFIIHKEDGINTIIER